MFDSGFSNGFEKATSGISITVSADRVPLGTALFIPTVFGGSSVNPSPRPPPQPVPPTSATILDTLNAIDINVDYVEEVNGEMVIHPQPIDLKLTLIKRPIVKAQYNDTTEGKPISGLAKISNKI